MLPLIASLALLQGQSDEPPRLRTLLDNHAVILVEPMRSPVISVQLFASSRYAPETEATHGYRHLLEHLLVRGPDGSLDRKLESQACFLEARTLRDAMQIELTVGPMQLQLALDTIGGLLRRPSFSQDEIDHEMRIMRDELALVEDPLRLSSTAWMVAYGDAGLDPLGTFDSMYRATPEKLADVCARQFSTDGLALVIAGPVDLDKATMMAKALLGPLPKSRFAAPKAGRVGKPGRGNSSGFGECRAAIVPEFNSPQAMASLAAALAMASELPSAFVTYTPTARNGLVLVGRTDSNSGLGLMIDQLADPSALYARGKAYAREWVERQLRTPSGVAYLRGLLLCQGEAYRPEMMLRQIEAMTPDEFKRGLKAFSSEEAAIAVGSR